MSDNNILAGISIDEIGAGKTKQDKIINITTQFNLSMKRLLILVQKYIKNNPHMSLVTKLVIYGDRHIPSQLIHKSYKNLLDPNSIENIMNRNINFFIDKSYDKYIKEDEFEEPLKVIISIIKTKLNELTDEEITYIWDLAGIMLLCAIKYQEYINTYN